MKLSQLFPGKVHADADIGGITLDSRHVRDGAARGVGEPVQVAAGAVDGGRVGEAAEL